MAQRKTKMQKHRKQRAIELFANGSPYRPKIVQSKKAYKRKPRTNKGE